MNHALACIAAICLTSSVSLAQALMGTSPYYSFDLVAKLDLVTGSGSTLDTGAIIDHNLLADYTIPHRFAMNDGGDLLAQYKTRMPAEPGIEGASDFRFALSAYGLVSLSQIGKPTINGGELGAIADDQTIMFRGEIFSPGSNIVPSGRIGPPPPPNPLDPPPAGIYHATGAAAASRDGDLYFLGNRVIDPVEGFVPGSLSLYRVGPLSSYNTPVLPYFPVDWEGSYLLSSPTIVPGNNGYMLFSEYKRESAGGGGDHVRHQILVVEPSANRRLVASAYLPDELSHNPGITHDGEFMAFAATTPTGVDIKIGQPASGSPFSVPKTVFSTVNLIGYDNDEYQIRFADILLDSIQILRHDVGSDGEIAGDALWVTFLGRPEAASRDNPITSTPLLFRNTLGAWALRVDVQRNIDSSLTLNASGPLPVVQVGDLFEGQPITNLGLSRALGRGTKDSIGSPRVPGRNDHIIGLRVETAASHAIVRATHFDDDEDGLPNHWEKPGGGVDADRDGVPDLDLHSLGANPRHKDLFIEMDWTPPREFGYPGGWNNRPSYFTLSWVERIFREAPVLNPDGAPGIRLHIDAGPDPDEFGDKLSIGGFVSVPDGQLQGGAQIVTGGDRIDAISMNGVDPSPPGTAFRYVPMGLIKDQFFSTADKWAREFAFRYVASSDFTDIIDRFPAPGGSASSIITVSGVEGRAITLSFDPPVPMGGAAPELPGNFIGIASGAAVGHFRECRADGPPVFNPAGQMTALRLRIRTAFTTIPLVGDRVNFIEARSHAEEYFRAWSGGASDPHAASGNHNRLGGNDIVLDSAGLRFLSLGVRELLEGRTLLHELGHTLALSHGGRKNDCDYLGDAHWSIMSYTHQLRSMPTPTIETGCTEPDTHVPTPPGLLAAFPDGVVESFSKGIDPMGFNEWDYIRLETWSSPISQGFSGNLPGPTDLDGPGPVIYEPLDNTPPRLVWHLPGPPVAVAPGALFTVEFTATDDTGVASVSAVFDADGDGSTSGAGESITPIALGGDRFRAVFSPTGSEGVRQIRITALDASGNRAVLRPNVLVGTGPPDDTTGPSLLADDPNEGSVLPSAGTVPVLFRSDDSSGLLRAFVRFDANGDGTVDPATEEFPSRVAETGLAGARIAWLPEISGPPGTRAIQIVADDCWFNRSTQSFNVTVRPLDLAAPVLTWTTGPADGSAIEYGENTLNMQVTAADSAGITQLSWVIDADGDGTIHPVFATERVRYFHDGSSTSVLQPMLVQTFLSGPSGGRTITVTATDGAGNSSSLSRTLVLTDTTPANVLLQSPGPGDPVRLGTAFNLTGTATDNDSVSLLRISFDRDGDGTVEPDEIIDAATGPDGSFDVPLAGTTGPAGPRRIRIVATDPSGNEFERWTEIVVGNGLLVHPPAGERWRVGSSAVACVELTQPPAPGRTVRFRFDVNGDGDLADPGENQLVEAAVPPGATQAPLPRAVTVFGSLSGPPGPRILTVEESGIPDASSTITVHIDELPFAGVSNRIAHIPLTTPLLASAGDGNSNATPVAALGGIVFFTATTPREGRELWRTDGTPEGTFLLRDLNPGYAEGLNRSPSGSDPGDFAVFGGRLFFAASEQPAQTFTTAVGSGRELWSSDGTVAGTQLFKDIAVGGANSSPRMLTVFGGKLWFVANDGSNGNRLWNSDGTPGGTIQWPESPLVEPGYQAHPAAFVIGSRMLFLNASGGELWQTDGSAASRISPPAAPGFIRLAPATSRLYMIGFTGTHHELWTSDGTAAGTQFLKTLMPATNSTPPGDMATLGNQVVFSAESALGKEAWISDGTPAGTRLLSDLWPGQANWAGIVPSGFPTRFTTVGASVLFNGLSPGAGEEPWLTDGTPPGTRVLADLTTMPWDSRASQVPPGSSPSDFLADSGGAWWVAGDDKRRTGRELWRWNGVSPPYLVRDLSPFAVSRDLGFGLSYQGPENSSPTALIKAGSSIYFSARDPLYGHELHRSDGTPAGTRRLGNLSADAVVPSALVRADGVMVPGFDGVNARLLRVSGTSRSSWLTDHEMAAGPPAHLVEFANGVAFSLPVRDAYGFTSHQIWHWPDAAPAPSLLTLAPFNTVWRLAAHGAWLWIAGVDGEHVQSLWRSDGSTHSRVTVLSGDNPALTLGDFLPDGARVFFNVSAGADREIWISDAAAPRRIMAAAGPAPTQAHGFILFGGRCYFAAIHNSQSKVWSTDGTNTGTAPLAGGNLATDWILPERRPVVANGRLLFGAMALTDPLPLWPTLWSSDGATTIELTAAANAAGTRAENIKHLTVAGPRAFFRALSSDPTGLGEELWSTDGTPGGTRFVRNIFPRRPGDIEEQGSDPYLLTALGNNIVFTANGGDGEGRELYVSDGTDAGTLRLAILWPGINPPEIEDLTNAGDAVYFTARTPDAGRELWRTDGTAAGTRLVQDLLPGPASADPSLVGAVSGKLLYFAHDGGDDPALRSYSTGPSAYETWLAEHFLAGEITNSAISGDARDPDLDGYPNLAEYMLGTDPRVFDRPGINWTRAGGDVVATFQVRADRGGVRVTLQQSGNLATWTDRATVTPDGSGAPGTMITLTLPSTPSGTTASRLFGRLCFSRQ